MNLGIEPKDVFIKLEFDKILELLVKECYTPMAAEILQSLAPDTDFKTLDGKLREVRDYKLILEKTDHLPLAAFPEILEDLKFLEIDGYTLGSEAFQRFLKVLQTTRDVFRFFGNGPKKEIYPKLYDLLRGLHFDDQLSKVILTVFDEQGNIRPDASPELVSIRKQVGVKLREMDARFRQIVQESRQKGWLADMPESFRNGRRVLAVLSEHKRKLRGIIHDESDTGRTTFIEPEAVVEINNDLFDLEQEERREIFKILKNLSTSFRPYSETLRQYRHLLVELDTIHAKARLALAMRANMPILKEKPVIAYRKAYHPLLYLKNKATGKKTIPFELKLNAEHFMLILSGPNAGGKSVAMKAVGLSQLMVQSGLLIPCHETSEIGIFKQVFADIGDQQSLDDDLSTYSSRLKNAKLFIQKATPETLVLIDEMGSGTDPKPGGSIAEAVLRQLHRKGVFAVITTHYSNLKVFAFRNPGLINGNMHFDKDTLSPTYELKVGKPGSSYAFEIAQKSGLAKDLIDYARKRTGSETEVDDLIIDLQREKQALEMQLKALREKEEHAERLIKSYDSLHSDLEIKRKRLKLDQKEFDLRQSANSQREIEKLIRQLSQEKNIEKAREMVVNMKIDRQETARAIDQIHEEVLKIESTSTKIASNKPLEKGDFVRLRSGGATGQIEDMDGKKAIVAMGGIKITVPLRDLLSVDAPIKQQANIATTDIDRSASFDAKLDIRGLSREEALQVIERFVDNGLLANSSSLRITHGKGDGILRNVVKSKLREYRGNVSSMYHPPQNEGGDGVTIIELA